MPIETWILCKLPQEKKTCHLCQIATGDEYYCLFDNMKKVKKMKKYIPQYYTNYSSQYKLSLLITYLPREFIQESGYIYTKINDKSLFFFSGSWFQTWFLDIFMHIIDR